jgi:hypothetical protein
VLARVGMTAGRMEEAMQACVRWTLNAWERSGAARGPAAAQAEGNR